VWPDLRRLFLLLGKRIVKGRVTLNVLPFLPTKAPNLVWEVRSEMDKLIYFVGLLVVLALIISSF